MKINLKNVKNEDAGINAFQLLYINLQIEYLNNWINLQV